VTELAHAPAAVAAASRRLAAEGLLIGTAGNVSVRVGDRVAVTATGVVLADCARSDVTVVDLDGSVIDGDLAPTSELGLHLAVYAATGAGAVVHTHAPFATAVACVEDRLPVLHYQQLLLGGELQVAPYATFGTAELAASVVAALDGRSAALMANHGAVTHASSLDGAVDHALLVEWLCALHHRAHQLGTPRVLDAQQQHDVITHAIELAYGSTRPAEESNA
jgi:L-fuculose-phosphate aldolase